jgi:hypothetical protein
MEKRLSTGRLNVGPKPARKTPEGQEGPKGLPLQGLQGQTPNRPCLSLLSLQSFGSLSSTAGGPRGVRAYFPVWSSVAASGAFFFTDSTPFSMAAVEE